MGGVASWFTILYYTTESVWHYTWDVPDCITVAQSSSHTIPHLQPTPSTLPEHVAVILYLPTPISQLSCQNQAKHTNFQTMDLCLQLVTNVMTFGGSAPYKVFFSFYRRILSNKPQPAVPRQFVTLFKSAQALLFINLTSLFSLCTHSCCLCCYYGCILLQNFFFTFSPKHIFCYYIFTSV